MNDETKSYCAIAEACAQVAACDTATRPRGVVYLYMTRELYGRYMRNAKTRRMVNRLREADTRNKPW